MQAYRPTLYGTRHAISAGHYLATMAGFSILEAGGNAVDAGCAAVMTDPATGLIAAGADPRRPAYAAAS